MGRSILNTTSTIDDKLVKIHYHRYDQRFGITYGVTGVAWRSGHFTTTTSNATLIVKGQMWGCRSYSDGCGEYTELCNSDGSAVQSSWRTNDGKRYWGSSYAGVDNGDVWAKFLWHWHQVYTGVQPGTYEIVCGWNVRNGTSGQAPFQVVHPDSNDDGRSRQHELHCEVWELKPSGGLTNTNLSQNNW